MGGRGGITMIKGGLKGSTTSASLFIYVSKGGIFDVLLSRLHLSYREKKVSVCFYFYLFQGDKTSCNQSNVTTHSTRFMIILTTNRKHKAGNKQEAM